MFRIQFIEIHEQTWFPSFLRDDDTDALQRGLGFLKAYAPIGAMLQSALDSLRSRSIFRGNASETGVYFSFSAFRNVPCSSSRYAFWSCS
jgi:hypothetical protein